MPLDHTIGTARPSEIELDRESAKLQAARDAERAERDLHVAKEFALTARLADALATASA